jgi:hypothetical protein
MTLNSEEADFASSLGLGLLVFSLICSGSYKTFALLSELNIFGITLRLHQKFSRFDAPTTYLSLIP